MKVLIIILQIMAALSITVQDIRMELKILRQENAELRYENAELKQALSDKDVELVVPWANLSKGKAPAPEDYIPGLQMIDEALLVAYTDVMKEYIDYFNVVQKSRMKTIAKLYYAQRDYMENVFFSYGIPTDVTALAIVESAMNPRAVSVAGAVGLWQLMPETARIYGLKNDENGDERTDIEKSTVVAARILSEAYSRYGSWPLAISSYNCGAGNVDKAINKAGTTEYWAVWDNLPKETKGFVPSLLGVLYYLKTNE